MSTAERIRVVTFGGVTYRKMADGSLAPLTGTADSIAVKSKAMADWARGELVDPYKTPVTIRLDRDLVHWFKAKGPRYQTRINAALRKFVEAHEEGG